MNYSEIWNILAQGNQIMPMNIFLIFGLLLLLLGIASIFSSIIGSNKAKISKPAKSLSIKNRLRVAFIGVGLCFIIFGMSDFLISKSTYDEATSAYSSNNYLCAEGKIAVEFEQPYDGHSRGDVIHIGKYRFEINYYLYTDYYHTTISHQGFLRNGDFVKVYFIPTKGDDKSFYGDGKIFRIDHRNGA